MKLTAEQFAELAATFDSGTGHEQHERRRASRMDLQARIKIMPVDGGKTLDPLSVTICDFSARGIAFIDETEMKLGSQFVLELPPREGRPVTMLCTVMHVKHVGGETYRMGSEFTCTLESATRLDNGASPNSAEAQRIRASMLG